MGQERYTDHTGTQLPMPMPGTILMGRPLFPSDKADGLLSAKEHPMMVLRSCFKPIDGVLRPLAITVALSHAETARLSPTSLPLSAEHARALQMHTGKHSHIICDAINVVALDARPEDNGLRMRAPSGSPRPPYSFGRVLDTDLVGAASHLANAFLKETGYAPPIQGGKPEQRRRRVVAVWEQRLRVVEQAARLAARDGMGAIQHLQPALARAGLESPQHLMA